MIRSLEVENFRSFCDRQVVNLNVAMIASDDGNALRVGDGGSEVNSPRIVGVFGANASGKSNLIQALSFVMRFFADSFSERLWGWGSYDAFCGGEQQDGVSRFAVEFSAPEARPALTDRVVGEIVSDVH